MLYHLAIVALCALQLNLAVVTGLVVSPPYGWCCHHELVYAMSYYRNLLAVLEAGWMRKSNLETRLKLCRPLGVVFFQWSLLSWCPASS